MNEPNVTIIRRKRNDEEEEHHGGVWKLAFADFMTAMMAFFLVMWLINSSSKETKTAIVQYFNPIQLVDTTPAPSGLQDKNAKSETKNGDRPAKETSEAQKDKEDALHRDPIKALDEIAAKEPAPPPQHNAPRDPFDRAAPSPPAATAGTAKAATLQAEIDRVVSQETRKPKIEVRQSEEGLLISLTDDANFSMFSVGSIEPKPQLVRIIGQIGKILAARRGGVELRGHTDARAYAGKTYDNWRLSSDRATVVNYMLVRGGLPAQRVEKIEGYADRRLKTPKDPLAPVNRRIEILLRGAEP